MPTWPILRPRMGLAAVSLIAQSPFVVSGVVIPAGAGQRPGWAGELAAQREHGTHAFGIDRRLAREAAARRVEQLVVAACGVVGRDIGESSLQDVHGLSAVGDRKSTRLNSSH